MRDLPPCFAPIKLLRTLLFSTILTVSINCLRPARAATFTIELTPESEAIIKHLGSLGVAIKHVRARCTNGGSGLVVAAYERFDNYILVCHGGVRDRVHLQESLTHESVHAIQDCLQAEGILGNRSIPISRYFVISNRADRNARFQELLRNLLKGRRETVEYLNDVSSSLAPAFYEMEREAHALETRPDLVINLIKNLALQKCPSRRNQGSV